MQITLNKYYVNIRILYLKIQSDNKLITLPPIFTHNFEFLSLK